MYSFPYQTSYYLGPEPGTLMYTATNTKETPWNPPNEYYWQWLDKYIEQKNKIIDDIHYLRQLEIEFPSLTNEQLWNMYDSDDYLSYIDYEDEYDEEDEDDEDDEYDEEDDYIIFTHKQ